MYRFLLSRRWAGFAVFVVVLATICVWLGNWQFSRLDDRQVDNVLAERHLAQDPVPLTDFTAASEARALDDEWTRVTATGRYDVGNEFVVKYQTRDLGPGVNVVTPLILDSGDAVLVDRGWLRTENNNDAVEDIPAPPTGTVEIEGWVRLNSTAKDSAITPTEGTVRAISSAGAAGSVPHDLFDGYLNLRDQSPASAEPLVPEPDPDLGQGPHFFYGLQWFFFGLLALFGLFFFARAEAKERALAKKHAAAKDRQRQSESVPTP